MMERNPGAHKTGNPRMGESSRDMMDIMMLMVPVGRLGDCENDIRRSYRSSCQFRF